MLSSTGVRMLPVGNSWTTAGVGGSIRLDAAIATAGTATVNTAASAIQRGAIGPPTVRVQPLAEAPRERRDQQRNRGEEQEVRGPRGHEQAPERVRFDVRPGREAFDHEERPEPPRKQCRDRPAPHAEHREEAGEGNPLREPSAPEELAKIVHLLAPVVDVQLEVAIERERDRAAARGEPRLLEGESRNLAEAPVLPEDEDEQSRDRRSRTGDPFAPPARSEVGQTDSDAPRADSGASGAPAAPISRPENTASASRSGDSERSAKSAAASTSTIDA